MIPINIAIIGAGVTLKQRSADFYWERCMDLESQVHMVYSEFWLY